ncbi:Phospholipid-Transporting Atpase Abca7 [Manis pentadactyla]|nr:Phospholipid-Transporting Atpase Abca7 [Manis pentadactyla]
MSGGSEIRDAGGGRASRREARAQAIQAEAGRVDAKKSKNTKQNSKADRGTRLCNPQTLAVTHTRVPGSDVREGEG